MASVGSAVRAEFHSEGISHCSCGSVPFLYLLLSLEVKLSSESQLIAYHPPFSWSGACYGRSCLRHRVTLEIRVKPMYHLGFRKSLVKPVT